jgi:tight adherence protein B
MTVRLAGRVTVVAVFAALLISPAALAAQQESIPISDVNSNDYPEVIIEFSVPAAVGSAELLPEELTLEENGEARAFSLRRIIAEDIHVVLVIDTSGSMAGAPIDQAKVAAQAFVERLPADSEVALIGFGNEPVVLTEFTTDQGAVLAAVAAIEIDPTAETSLYDATRLAVQQFSPTTTGPRYVIVVTDGKDTISEASLGTAQSAVQAADVPVFAISLVTFESDPVALAALTAETGGGVVEADDPTGLAELTEQVAAAITAQYEARYVSEAHGRTDIEIRIERSGETAIGRIGIDLPLLVIAVPTATTAPTAEPTSVAPAAAPPEPSRTLVVGVPTRSWLLPVGILFVALALLILFNFLLWPVRRRRRNPLRDIGPVAGNAARTSGGLLASASASLVRAAERMVARRDGAGLLAHKLDRAGIRMRPAEYVVMVSLFAVVAMLIGLLISAGFGLFLGVMVLAVAWLTLSIKGDRRSARFEEQLPTTLRMMGGGLRGGFSLSQVVELVANEASSPTGDEFARLNVEENLGRDIAESFRDVARRMKSEDFMWVAEAVDINRSVGGDLSNVLESVSETIRTRQRIKGDIQTMSAEGRISARILLALPFVIFFGSSVSNPEFSGELTGTSEGRIAVLVGFVLMGIATIWMRRIVRLKY